MTLAAPLLKFHIWNSFRLELTKTCQVCIRFESEIPGGIPLELLVFGNKSHVFLLVQCLFFLVSTAFHQSHFLLKIFLHPFIHILIRLRLNLVFNSKSIVPFRIYDFIVPFDTSIDSFACGFAIEAHCRVPLNAVSTFWAAFDQVLQY